MICPSCSGFTDFLIEASHSTVFTELRMGVGSMPDWGSTEWSDEEATYICPSCRGVVASNLEEALQLLR